MEYTVPFHSEITGDAVPLRNVAEAMARKAATNFGTRKLHYPSLINTRTRYQSSLLRAVREGALKVCSNDGIAGSVDELVNGAEGFIGEWIDDDKPMMVLHVKRAHLYEWGATNGDVFHLVDVSANVLEFGQEKPDGTKECRGHVDLPFDYFGGHGYFDVEHGGISIELADDDFATDKFVKVASAVAAVAKFLLSKGSPNKFQAERDAWPLILKGVTQGVLHPVSPEKLQPLSVEHYNNGMVRFDELVAWGRSTKLFDFTRVANTAGVTGDKPNSRRSQDGTRCAEREGDATAIRCGSNPANVYRAWIAEQAGKLEQPGDILKTLGERIRLKAEEFKYRNESGDPIPLGTVIKWIPKNTTGGRRKNGRKPQKLIKPAKSS